MENNDPINILLCWQILATSITIYSIVLCIKKIVIISNVKMKDNKDFKIILTFLNTFLGVVFAFIPNFLPGNSFQERAITGLVCGFLSNYSYIFIKRFIGEKKVNGEQEE